MKRRDFLKGGLSAAAIAAGYVMTPEGIWHPDQRLISVPGDIIIKTKIYTVDGIHCGYTYYPPTPILVLAERKICVDL